MELFRISRDRYIRDLSGEGAQKYGGRWNSKETAALYTSQHESLAVLEVLAHSPVSVVPKDLSLLVLSVPDSLTPDEFKRDDLPRNWKNYPAPHELIEMGTNWFKSGANLMLKVPSVLVYTEWNILINPAHPDIKKVSITGIRKFSFDARLVS